MRAGPKILDGAREAFAVGDLGVSCHQGQVVSRGGDDREAVGESDRVGRLQSRCRDHPSGAGQVEIHDRPQTREYLVCGWPAVVALGTVVDLDGVDPAHQRPRRQKLLDAIEGRPLPV